MLSTGPNDLDRYSIPVKEWKAEYGKEVKRGMRRLFSLVISILKTTINRKGAVKYLHIGSYPSDMTYGQLLCETLLITIETELTRQGIEETSYLRCLGFSVCNRESVSVLGDFQLYEYFYLSEPHRICTSTSFQYLSLTQFFYTSTVEKLSKDLLTRPGSKVSGVWRDAVSDKSIPNSL